MKIGIVGSGIVGRVLGNAFLQEGYNVMLGSRNPNKDEVVKWKNENENGLTGNFEETTAFGDLIVLSTAGKVIENAVDLAGKNNFTGKIVIDTTNPLDGTPPVNGLLKYFTGPDDSLMERLQNILPEARLVKAFNSVGNAVMYKPGYKGTLPTMFICGNDVEAKTTVSGILQKFGWETEDMGPAAAARVIEPLCILWCIPGFLRNEWTHAFKLLKK
jgi:hypothetical protein